ncbi:hypothetical protein VYU27_004547 [Nannochloropsis oceanica]
MTKRTRPPLPPPPFLSFSLPLFLLLQIILDAATAFLLPLPTHPPRLRQPFPPPYATTTSSPNNNNDDVSPCLPTSSSFTYSSSIPTRTRLCVRPANKADLRRVATMQVAEYGGDGILFFWHYLQELDRLQTSYWVEPVRHTMLVLVDDSSSSPSSLSPSSSSFPFSPLSVALRALDNFFLGDPRIVGFVDLDARERRVDKTTPDPYLSDLIVDASRRGQGLGKALMLEAEAEAERWGFPAVYLKVRKNNARGYGLYASLGYQVLWEWPGEGVWLMRKWVMDEGEEAREEAEKKEREDCQMMVGTVMMPCMNWVEGEVKDVVEGRKEEGVKDEGE